MTSRLGETRALWCDSQATVLRQSQEFPQDLQGVRHLCLAYTEEAQAQAQQWLDGVPEEIRVWHASWPDAALAGAFSGQAGLLLTTEHWTMYCGCAARNGPEAICQALVMVREANHRTLTLAHGEGGLEWLCREAMRLPAEVTGTSRLRLQRSLGELLERKAEGLAEMRLRARVARQRVEELADFPGPDPACLALLAKSGRRLSDLLRRLAARCHLPQRAAWLDGRLEGPWWEALRVELERYLPELRWRGADGPPEWGCALLVLGALKEEERVALNPQARPGLLSRFQPVHADCWRQLSRLRHSTFHPAPSIPHPAPGR